MCVCVCVANSLATGGHQSERARREERGRRERDQERQGGRHHDRKETTTGSCVHGCALVAVCMVERVALRRNKHHVHNHRTYRHGYASGCHSTPANNAAATSATSVRGAVLSVHARPGAGGCCCGAAVDSKIQGNNPQVDLKDPVCALASKNDRALTGVLQSWYA